ncbi:immunoglobulin-like domain-containing receptor 2 isoform X4 [Ochotona princeps]|uniref:immunoglobulin-like domain-containing receptor 2 isoform X4 n=1 Tax=Ochotona princeps TaxID=9978 RepID=UPI0027155F96|nr:immunoglobulin-like domain-containing receptor 2 isoform X4 [Ochotona princeps]
MRRRAPRRSPSPRQRALQAARPGARLRQRERPGGWWAAGGGAQGRPVPAGARGYRPAAARRGGLPTNRAFQPLPALLTSDLHGKLGAMDRVVLAWVALFWLTAMVEGLQVTVPDKKKIAMLFQPTVLRCHFSTSSHQPAVVQWKFKSYCQDRMGESLGMSSTRIQSLSKRNLEWDPYLDCLDSRRTVRVVASKQGSTVTLGEFYRGREITIVHDADLQIGKLMWGDSGLYYCIITTPDDLEGKNEDSVEVLVLGRTGLLADLLPSFAVEIMPEWVFIGLVILGIFLFFVLVGICWCQCCPHSCCCYVRCPCCPDSCCCPQAFRKGYRIQADKERDSMKVLYYVEKELAQFDPARRMRGRYNNTISELSSLHEEDSNFRQSYHQMRSKQFPVSGDLESNPDYWSGVMGGSSGASRGPSALEYNKEDRENFRHSQQRSKSEMLSRKNFATGVPAVSMDELAAFADSYGQRPRRANGNSHEARGGSRFERSESRAHGPFYQDSSLEEYYGPRSRSRSREPLTDAERGWSYSPPRRRPAEDAHLPRLVSRTPGTAPKYDHSYLSSVLERQSRPEAASRGGSLETPSKLSARLGPRSASYYAWSPPSTYKAGAAQGADDDDDDDDEDDDDDGDAPDDALPPYSERELSRGPSYRSRDLSFHSNSEKRRKKEPAKKTNDFPTRMSLVV